MSRQNLIKNLRKINTILSVILIILLLLHGITGSFELLGIGSGSLKLFAWAGVGLLAVHALIGFILTVQTILAGKRSGGRHYLKENSTFWIRRCSGAAILLLIFFHIGMFSREADGTYELIPFTTIRLIAMLLLIFALAIHLFVNIRPLLISLGVFSFREKRTDLTLILAVLVLFMTASVILYYISWWF